MLKTIRSAAQSAWSAVKSSLTWSLSNPARRIAYRVSGLFSTRSWRTTKYNRYADAVVSDPYARRAVQYIATNMVKVVDNLYVVRGEGDDQERVEGHPVQELLKRPHPRYSLGWMVQGWVWQLMLAGEFWLDALGPDTGRRAGQPRRLKLWREEEFVDFIEDRTGEITGYEFSADFPSRTYASSQRVERSVDDTLHVFTYNPGDPDRGLSIVASVIRQLESMAEADDWNSRLAERGGQVDTYLVPTGLDPGESLTEKTVDDIQEMADRRLRESREGSGAMVLSGALEPKETGITPKDAQFLDGQKFNGRRIAIGLGIDPILIGDSESQTFSNYEQAREQAYEETILPLLDFILTELNQWLMPRYGDDARLAYDPGDIAALQTKYKDKVDAEVAAVEGTIKTPDEARQALGLDTVGADDLLVPVNRLPLSDLMPPDASSDFSQGGDGEATDPEAVRAAIRGLTE